MKTMMVMKNGGRVGCELFSKLEQQKSKHLVLLSRVMILHLHKLTCTYMFCIRYFSCIYSRVKDAHTN